MNYWRALKDIPKVRQMQEDKRVQKEVDKRMEAMKQEKVTDYSPQLLPKPYMPPQLPKPYKAPPPLPAFNKDFINFSKPRENFLPDKYPSNPNIKIYGMDRMKQPDQKTTIIEAKYLAPSEIKPVASLPNPNASAGVAV